MVDGIVVVLGMGEVGQPLFRILSRKFNCAAVDIEPVEIKEPCAVLHVCYPFAIPDYVGTTARYIEKYNPRLTMVGSPGTELEFAL